MATRRRWRTLILDIGGSHVKAGFSDRTNEIKIPSGPDLNPERMVKKLARALAGQRYDRVSIGYPGVVVRGRIVGEPHNLGPGWVGFDFEHALGRPTRIVNDAAMQALGSYQGGRMLFLGLGTGLGTAMVLDGVLAPMELAHLPYKKGKVYEEFVGEAALVRYGRKKWEREVFDVTALLVAALEPEYVVLGGGNVRKLRRLPPRAVPGDNRNAVLGGIRLWEPTAESPRARPKPRRRRR
ncbi:MAG TPA: ROK family protein [Thermoplasmata archaeon]|nr:ROK family protein [Thermoplasmata archaeon]